MYLPDILMIASAEGNAPELKAKMEWKRLDNARIDNMRWKTEPILKKKPHRIEI